MYPSGSHFDFVETQTINVTFSGSLRPELEQLDATAAVMTSLQNTGGAILSLATGQGKTTCACWVMAQLRVKTVVLVHKDVLKTQWAERISQFLPTASVSYIQGTTCDMSGDVVIAMIQTLVSGSRTYDFSGVGCVVVDECHRICAETFSQAMRGLCCPYSLGLSATPTRKDGLTKIMHWFLGPQAYVSQRRDMKNVIVEMVKYSCPRYRQPLPMTRFGTVNHAALLTDMADDPVRTKLIIRHIQKLREDPDRIILVLSHRRDHCTEIAKQIPGAVAFLGGGKKSTAHTTAPVVCATYSLASEGYDDPRLNALVLATPCSDVTQAAGRILRGTPTIDPVIVDVMDDFSVAYAQAAKRKGFYAKSGFTYATQVKKEYPRCIIIE
jgi:superfamily II DNA or RNA helicase